MSQFSLAIFPYLFVRFLNGYHPFLFCGLSIHFRYLCLQRCETAIAQFAVMRNRRCSVCSDTKPALASLQSFDAAVGEFAAISFFLYLSLFIFSYTYIHAYVYGTCYTRGSSFCICSQRFRSLLATVRVVGRAVFAAVPVSRLHQPHTASRRANRHCVAHTASSLLVSFCDASQP